jgi:hypothetical protein
VTLKPLNARRLSVALCAALALACAGAARAQAGGRAPRAEKLDEYVNQFNSCNAGAYLDNFAIHLQNNPTTTAHIIIYGPGGPDDSYGERAVRATKGYLVATRGIEESRVNAVYAGRYRNMQELVTELWLVPEGAQPPPVTRYKPDLKFEGRYAELTTWDGPPGGGDVGGWSDSQEAALVGLSDLMRRRAGAVAYVVAYHDGESAPGAWRRAAGGMAVTLRENGVAADRVKTIFGGYAKEPKARLWILPADSKPPTGAKQERRPERSVQLTSLDESQLKNGEGERWAFKGLADVLKADAELTACLVLRLAHAAAREAGPDATVDPDEPPDIDLVRLSEQWKAELKKNGVGEHRLIVMVVPPTREWSSMGLETWVVPPGALLPDPSADEEAIEEEDNPKEF